MARCFYGVCPPFMCCAASTRSMPPPCGEQETAGLLCLSCSSPLFCSVRHISLWCPILSAIPSCPGNGVPRRLAGVQCDHSAVLPPCPPGQSKSGAGRLNRTAPPLRGSAAASVPAAKLLIYFWTSAGKCGIIVQRRLIPLRKSAKKETEV